MIWSLPSQNYLIPCTNKVVGERSPRSQIWVSDYQKAMVITDTRKKIIGELVIFTIVAMMVFIY